MADPVAGAQRGGLPIHQRWVPDNLQRTGTRTPRLQNTEYQADNSGLDRR